MFSKLRSKINTMYTCLSCLDIWIHGFADPMKPMKINVHWMVLISDKFKCFSSISVYVKVIRCIHCYIWEKRSSIWVNPSS